MALTPATNKQIPDQAILDYYNKQVYLGNKFIYAASLSVTTSETPALLLSNPSTNTVALFQDLRRLASITASDDVILRFYIAPTVTASGIIKTPVNMRAASTTTSQAVLSSSPTVSTNGTLVAFLVANAFAVDSSDSLIVLDPGQSILVTSQGNASDSALIEFGWFEL